MSASEETLAEIQRRMVRVETKLDDLKEVMKSAAEARDTARDALQYAKSAHKRLDRIDKIVFWAGTTAIGALIVGAITLLYRGQGG